MYDQYFKQPAEDVEKEKSNNLSNVFILVKIPQPILSKHTFSKTGGLR